MTHSQRLHAFVIGICTALVLILLLPLGARAQCPSQPHTIPSGLTDEEGAIFDQITLETDQIAALFGIDCGQDGGAYRLESPILGPGITVLGVEEHSGLGFSVYVIEYTAETDDNLIVASIVGRLVMGTSSIYFAGLYASLVDENGTWHHSLIPLFRLGSRTMVQVLEAQHPSDTQSSQRAGGAASQSVATDPVAPPRDSIRDPASPTPDSYQPNVPPVEYVAACFCPNGELATGDSEWTQAVEDAWLAKEGAQAAAADRLDACVAFIMVAIVAILATCIGIGAYFTGGLITVAAVKGCSAFVGAAGLFLELAVCFKGYFEEIVVIKNQYNTALSIACNQLINRGGCD